MVKLPGWWYNNHIKSSLVCVTLAAGKAPGKPGKMRQISLREFPDNTPGNPMDFAAIKKRGWCKL